jgi:hypothetical protein
MDKPRITSELLRLNWTFVIPMATQFQWKPVLMLCRKNFTVVSTLKEVVFCYGCIIL